MKAYTALLLLILIFISCKKDKADVRPDIEACGVQDPVRKLPWLRKLIQQTRDNKEDGITTITLTEIAGKTVFNYYVSYMSCIGCISYYCDGTRVNLTAFSEQQLSDYYQALAQRSGKTRIIWPE